MTTIVSVRRNGQVVVGGDGQVSLGNTVMKGNARKVRRLYNGKVLAGFAGGTADACSQDGMDVGRKGGFVYGHRLIELEIAADGFRVEIEIIEVKSEQHVALLDVARAQNAVP